MSTSYQPRYPESGTYDSLTDLLSDGFPEDTPVYVFQDGTPTATSSISALRAEYQKTAPASFAKLRRVVAVANESYAQRTPSGSMRYALALITEDEPGWSLGHWYRTLEEAQSVADLFNRGVQITPDEVRDVLISSMRAGRVR
jgi:hypothetical protein